MRKVITILLFINISCTSDNTQTINQKMNIPESKSYVNSTRQNKNKECLKTIQDIEICELDGTPIAGQITNIEKNEISFYAFAHTLNNKNYIVKPTPIDYIITDYENLSKQLGEKVITRINSIKSSYKLIQGRKKILVRSFKYLDLKPNTEYLFNAVCYEITTTQGKRDIVIIREVHE